RSHCLLAGMARPRSPDTPYVAQPPGPPSLALRAARPSPSAADTQERGDPWTLRDRIGRSATPALRCNRRPAHALGTAGRHSRHTSWLAPRRRSWHTKCAQAHLHVLAPLVRRCSAPPKETDASILRVS